MKELSLAEKLFKKVSKKERDKVKLEQRKAEIEAKAKNSKLLAEYLDVDPTVVRLIWALLICFAGSGLLLYIICAIVFPTKSDVMKEQEKDEDTIEVKSKEKKEKKSK